MDGPAPKDHRIPFRGQRPAQRNVRIEIFPPLIEMNDLDIFRRPDGP